MLTLTPWSDTNLPMNDLYTKPGHLIRRAHQISSALFAEECGAFDLTSVQYAALVAIRTNPGVDATRLSSLIAFAALKLRPQFAFKFWAWQLGVAVLIAIVIIVGRHGPGLLLEAPAIAKFGRETGTREAYQGILPAPGDGPQAYGHGSRLSGRTQAGGHPFRDGGVDERLDRGGVGREDR